MIILSMHYKNTNNQDLCIMLHTITYLIGNVGIVMTFS